MASHRRGPWSQVEDNNLCHLVQTQGALNWVRIAQLIGSRSPKQCRERYHQNLKPTLNHEPISPEEGAQIERMVSEMGKRWAEIARRLHGRSDNAVKNWWNGSMNRRRRLVLRGKNAASGTPQPQKSQNNHYEVNKDQSQMYSQPQATHIYCSGRYPSHHSMDRVMSSPTVSEASRAESVDGTPSLVSDAGSALSYSPQSGNSSSLELPPLNDQARDPRKLSIPVLTSRLNQNSSGNDIYTFNYSPYQHQNNIKMQSLGTTLPTYRCLDQQRYGNNTTSLLHPQTSKSNQLQAFMDPSVRLPPLRPRNQIAPPNQILQRDSRMHLSSVLG